VRRRRGALAVLSTLLLSLLAAGFAGSAVAGGPTSVLLVVPGEGRTAALYTGSADYEQLATLVGAYGTATGSTTPPKTASNDGASGTNDASGPGVTLTWLMHDVNVWRVDRVYLKAEGGPLISTQSTLNGGDLWANPPTWRQAGPDGKALIALLDRLGVGNAGAGTAVTNSAAKGGNVQPSTAAAAPVPAPTASDSKDSGGLPGPDGWIWGPVGLLLGLALAVGVPAVRKRMTTPVHSPDDDPADETDAAAVDVNAAGTVDTPGPGNAVGTVNAMDALHKEMAQRTETLSSHPLGR
jgi:hypothetical protein